MPTEWVVILYTVIDTQNLIYLIYISQRDVVRQMNKQQLKLEVNTLHKTGNDTCVVW